MSIPCYISISYTPLQRYIHMPHTTHIHITLYTQTAKIYTHTTHIIPHHTYRVQPHTSYTYTYTHYYSQLPHTHTYHILYIYNICTSYIHNAQIYTNATYYTHTTSYPHISILSYTAELYTQITCTYLIYHVTKYPYTHIA